MKIKLNAIIEKNSWSYLPDLCAWKDGLLKRWNDEKNLQTSLKKKTTSFRTSEQFKRAYMFGVVFDVCEMVYHNGMLLLETFTNNKQSY